MKHVFTHLAFLCLFGSLYAQQDPQFSQYMYNKLFMNPAYAGMKHAICFTGIARQQWAGFEGAPRTGVLSGDFYAERLHGGIGLNLMYDELGFERTSAYRINYSFHLEEILGGTFGIGLEGGMVVKSLGPSGSQEWISTTSWQADQSIPPRFTSYNLDLGAGLWFERDDMWVGISTTHLAPAKYDDGLVSVGMNQHALIFDVAHHYFITGGYSYEMRQWKLQPSFLVKSDATITSFDLNFTALFNDKVWFGASYRHQDAICPMIGFNWVTGNSKSPVNRDSYDGRLGGGGGRPSPQMLRIGFAYDCTLSELRNYNSGSFELFVNYCLPWEPPRGGGGDVRIFE